MFNATKTKALSRTHLSAERYDHFEAPHRGSKRKALEQQICEELIIHAEMEEEAFSPVVRKALPRRQKRCWH